MSSFDLPLTAALQMCEAFPPVHFHFVIERPLKVALRPGRVPAFANIAGKENNFTPDSGSKQQCRVMV